MSIKMQSDPRYKISKSQMQNKNKITNKNKSQMKSAAEGKHSVI